MICRLIIPLFSPEKESSKQAVLKASKIIQDLFHTLSKGIIQPSKKLITILMYYCQAQDYDHDFRLPCRIFLHIYHQRRCSRQRSNSYGMILYLDLENHPALTRDNHHHRQTRLSPHVLFLYRSLILLFIDSVAPL